MENWPTRRLAFGPRLASDEGSCNPRDSESRESSRVMSIPGLAVVVWTPSGSV